MLAGDHLQLAALEGLDDVFLFQSELGPQRVDQFFQYDEYTILHLEAIHN